MKISIWIVGVMVVVAGAACAQGPVMFADTFDAPALGQDWTVAEGGWSVADGALTNNGGGLIVLNQTPGSRFELEVEANLPGNWVSIILFYETPGDYGTLYFGGGYWESFEMEGGQIADYIQRRDPTIQPGVDHQIKAVADRGRITLYYDGVLKGEADLRPRPGARLAFRNIEKGGRMQIKSVRLSKPSAAEDKVVRALQPTDLAQCQAYSEEGLEGALSKSDRPSGDAASGLQIKYAFNPGDLFQSRFIRLPLEAGPSKYVLLDVAGDGSGNKLFVIIHDRSGEQHLVGDFPITWKGWQECVTNLSAFLQSPLHKQRFHTRWGGDENQQIDFPVTAVDIGVAKRGARLQDKGEIRFRNLRVVE